MISIGRFVVLPALFCLLMPTLVLGEDMEPNWVFMARGDTLELYASAHDGAGGAYVLARETSTISFLIHVDTDGRESWRLELPFGGSGLSVNDEGVYCVGFHYRDNQKDHGVIYTPDVALVDHTGKLVWHVIPPPPIEVEQEGDKESIWDLSAVGDAELWEAVALSTGCVAMGRGSSDKGSFIYHLYIDGKGEVAWQTVDMASVNWMYSMPNKIEPFLGVSGGSVYSAGAYQITPGGAELSVLEIDLSTGKVVARYEPKDSTYLYTGGTLNARTGQLALGYMIRYPAEGEPGIIILDGDLALRFDVKSPIRPWSGMAWDNEDTLWVGGSVSGERQFVNYPALVKFQVSEEEAPKTVGKIIWNQDRLFDYVDIAVSSSACLVVYSVNVSERDDIIDKTELMLHKIESEKDVLIYHFDEKSGLFNDPSIFTTRTGYTISMGYQKPILMYFKR